MFFNALIAALLLDGLFIVGVVVVALIAGLIVFLAGKTGHYSYYCEFSRAFFQTFGVFLIIGILGWGLNLVLENREVSFKDLKNPSISNDDIRSVVQADYSEKIKNAKDAKQRKLIDQQYEDNGFTTPKTADGKLKINDNSKIPYRLIHAAEIRHKMEQSSGNYIKLSPFSTNSKSLPVLAQKKNQAAVAIWKFMVGFRSFIWLGIWFLISLIPLFIGFSIKKQGTEEQIREELTSNN